MDHQSEHLLLKALLNHDFYSSNGRIVPVEAFGSNTQGIVNLIIASHEKDDSDVSLGEIRALYMEKGTFTKAQRMALNNLFDVLEDTPTPTPSNSIELAILIGVKHKATRIMECLVPIINGESQDLSPVEALISDSSESQEALKAVDLNLDSLLDNILPENRFKFRLPVLQEHLQGVGRGNLIVVFGRPDAGKSSLVGDIAVGFAEQKLKVNYYGNEEPMHKIALNVIRSALGISDKELIQLKKEKRLPTDKIQFIGDSIKFYDMIGMSMSDLHAHIKSTKPDAVIFDQTDKINLAATEKARHEELKQLYVRTREIAKRENCVVFNISQASAEAEGRREVTFDMLDGSKTGKAGEVDLAIGVGLNKGVEEDHHRFLTVSKNKINGFKGMLTCLFDPATNTWSG